MSKKLRINGSELFGVLQGSHADSVAYLENTTINGKRKTRKRIESMHETCYEKYYGSMSTCWMPLNFNKGIRTDTKRAMNSTAGALPGQ